MAKDREKDFLEVNRIREFEQIAILNYIWTDLLLLYENFYKLLINILIFI